MPAVPAHEGPRRLVGTVKGEMPNSSPACVAVTRACVNANMIHRNIFNQETARGKWS